MNPVAASSEDNDVLRDFVVVELSCGQTKDFGMAIVAFSYWSRRCIGLTVFHLNGFLEKGILEERFGSVGPNEVSVTAVGTTPEDWGVYRA